MELRMFTIHDSKAAAYLPPFVLPEEDMAIRSFADCVNDISHAFYRNPGDYTLFSIGKFDANKGVLLPAHTVSLGNGVDFIKQTKIPGSLVEIPDIGKIKERLA